MRGHQQGWHSYFLGRLESRKSRRTTHARVHQRRLRCEPLEQRCLLSVVPYVVDSLSDVVASDGAITLREALEAANTNTAVGDAHAGSSMDTDVIRFADGLAGTVTLGGTQLEITDELEIQGPGAESLRIDAGGQSRVFHNQAITTISGLTITGGWSDVGGGIWNEGTLTVTNSNILGNSANASEWSCGGGIFNDTGTLTVTNSTLSGNSVNGTYGYGGGIFNESGTVTVSNSTLSGNWARGTSDGDGGGICTHSGTITLVNSIVSGNDNGGISGSGSWSQGVKVTVVDSTIAGNSGGGIIHSSVNIYGLADLTIVTSIVALNSGPDIPAIPLSPPSGFNLIGGDPHFVRNPSPGPDGLWGTEDDDYGDLHLRSDSPAINAGSNAMLPADSQDLDGDDNTTEPLPIDLEGKPRVIYDTADIGAYEYWLTGDLNEDRFVGADDLDITRANWGQNVTPYDWSHGDVSSDGFVGADDLDLIRAHWGEFFILPPELPAAPTQKLTAAASSAKNLKPVVHKAVHVAQARVHDAVLADFGERKASTRTAALSQGAWRYTLQQPGIKDPSRTRSSEKATDAALMATTFWNSKL